MERKGSEGGISSRPQGALSLKRSRAAFSLKGVISQNKLATILQLSHKKDERRRAFGA